MAQVTIDIENLCAWGDPKRLMTRLGPRILRTAAPNQEFWKLWKFDKPGARAAGLGCSYNYATHAWEIQWWAEVERDVAKIEASAAVSADMKVPAPDGLSYLPYQIAGIKVMSTRPNNLLADEMGLGKTIQALGLINLDTSIKRILVICPASLKHNWSREARKWLVRDFPIRIIQNGKQQWAVESREFTIINFDILRQHEFVLRNLPWDLLIVDESHNLKSHKAARTRQVIGYRKRGEFQD